MPPNHYQYNASPRTEITAVDCRGSHRGSEMARTFWISMLGKSCSWPHGGNIGWGDAEGNIAWKIDVSASSQACLRWAEDKSSKSSRWGSLALLGAFPQILADTLCLILNYYFPLRAESCIFPGESFLLCSLANLSGAGLYPEAKPLTMALGYFPMMYFHLKKSHWDIF